MDRRAATPLIVLGVILALLGVLVRLGWLRWFGHLPGDIRIERGRTRVYAPIASLLLVSLVLSVLSALARRWF
jgi:DUF2905 family protein